MATEDLDGRAEVERSKDLPMAFGGLGEHRPIDQSRLEALLRPFVGASVGECYFGPAGIGDDGVPWVVFVTPDQKRPRLYRDRGQIGMLGWRWDATPSMYVSLTVMGVKEPRPHVRWMAASDDPVMQAIRQSGRLFCCLAHPEGSRSGWFEVYFRVGGPKDAVPSTSALEAQWKHPVRGIPGSRVGFKYEPFADLDDEDVEQVEDTPVGDNEIPMWSDRVGDGWRTLYYNGPWAADLEDRDRKATAWASWFHHTRSRAAGFIQMIKERQENGLPSMVDPKGLWRGSSRAPQVNEVFEAHPTIRDWLTALAGSRPDAKAAHEAALAVIHAPKDMYAFLATIMFLLNDVDEVFALAVQHSFQAAMLDTRITDRGRRRPWLANTGDEGMELRTMVLDGACDRKDLETLWRAGLEFPDLIDAGLWLGPADLPAPLDMVNDALASVRLESSPQDAFERVMHLLHEAQEARQWSIPWGARVQLQFGPFLAMRIFERDGEFSCLFLDERERYLHVAIGLGKGTPRISQVRFVRPTDDDGKPVWNEDAQVSLQLIAAAVVRDFLVVEDRDSLFSSRPMRRQIAGRKISTVVYLPRVRYNRLHADAIADATADTHFRARHAVSHHLRRVGSASPAQRFLAQRYGINLPEGFTFVRPHERGVQHHEEQVRTYRSRSASRMLFEAIAAAPEGSRPAWFQFEKDCARLLAAEGMRVVHQAAHRDGDGGMDLFAADAQESWVVQCKCWAPHRQVGPEVVRELVGAIAKADRGSSRKSGGMIITTSTLTSGAASEALENGFRIIDGPTFAKMIGAI